MNRRISYIVTGCVVPKCSRIVHTTELQVMTRMSRKLMKIATSERGEVALGRPNLRPVLRARFGNEQWLLMVFSCGAHGN
jgi:hypothetical protein